MNELITVTETEEKQTVSARELHECLEIKTAFKDWFPRMCEYGFEDGKDFCSFMSESTGGRPSKEYSISIEMAKQICMLQRSEKGKQYREYFLKLEQAWNSPEMVMQRALQISNRKVEELKKSLFEAKPAIEFYKDCGDSKNAIDMRTVAKMLDLPYGHITLYKKLRDIGILNLDNTPRDEYCHSGYFNVVISVIKDIDGNVIKTTKTTKVYPKGIEFIKKQLIKAGEIKE